MPIAIIGMSCKFPGNVNSPEDLWQLLAEGRSGWSEIPTSRFHLDGVYHPNSSKVNTVRTNIDVSKKFTKGADNIHCRPMLRGVIF